MNTLEEITAQIRHKQDVSQQDRIWLALMAFKEEAGCKKSSL